MFRSGELHLVLLALIAERAQHGYDLMAELEIRLDGAYTPSPGSIYPALSALEAEGLVEAREEGDRRVFSITETGRAALADRARMLAAVETRTGMRLSDDAVGSALDRLGQRAWAVSSDVGADSVVEVLRDAEGRLDELEKEAKS